MLSVMRRFWNRSELERKLIVIVSVIIIFITGSFSIFSIMLVKKQYENMIYRSLATSASLITNELTNNLNNVVILSDMIRSDALVLKHLNLINLQTSDYLVERSYDTLYQMQQAYFQQYKKKYLAYSAIINPQFISYTYGFGYTKLSKERVAALTSAASAGRGGAIWMPDYADKDYLFLARQIKKIDNLELTDLGTLAIAIDMDALLSSITSLNTDFQNTYWVFSQKEQLVYSSEQLGITSLNSIPDLKKSYGLITIKGHRYFALHGKLKNPDWEYYQLLPYDSMAASQMALLISYILSLLIGLALTILLIHIFIRRITSDIGVLIEKIKSFRGDNASVVSVPNNYYERRDEIALLHQYFDSMAQEIETFINKDYKLNIDLKNMQLKALAAQINPHFLYNTLESINWRAKTAGNTEISLMVESLGALLRAALSQKQSTVLLSEEINLVNCYLTIQKIRYEERLQYTIELDDTLMNVQLPPLSIQPLVENAIKYGLEESIDGCHILLTAKRTSDHKLLIQVKNSGSCFEDDLLEKLSGSTLAAHGLGIGLLNINQRIQLLFGTEYGLFLHNEDGYAIASMLIPAD